MVQAGNERAAEKGHGFSKAFFSGHRVTVQPLGEVSRPH